jgi:Fe(3+) dicitrate transport protein
MISTHNDVDNLSGGVVTSAIDPAIDAHEALPTISVEYAVDPSWSVFANVGVSFGPEQYSQLASTTEGLHPEKATTYEIGTHYDGDNFKAELTAFYIDFDQELLLSRDSVGDGTWTNLGATTHRGIEAGAQYDMGGVASWLDGLSLNATYTYTEATFDAGGFAGKDLPFYSRNVGTVGASYRYEAWLMSADVFAESGQHSPGDPTSGDYVTQEDASGRLGDIPGYGVVNLRLAYQPENNKNAPLLAFGVKNLFNKEYFTRSTDNDGGKFVGQPRTFFVNASVTF